MIIQQSPDLPSVLINQKALELLTPIWNETDMDIGNDGFGQKRCPFLV